MELSGAVTLRSRRRSQDAGYHKRSVFLELHPVEKDRARDDADGHGYRYNEIDWTEISRAYKGGSHDTILTINVENQEI